MRQIIDQNINDYYSAHSQVYRAEIGATIAVATTGTYFVGMTTGAVPLRILSRAYSSSEFALTIELFEATWSGGVNARTLNKDLGGNQTPPVQFLGGVTPGTLTTVLTGITLRAPTSGGTAQVSLQADNNVLITKPNASYVIRFTNGGGVNAIIGASIEYRLIQPDD